MSSEVRAPAQIPANKLYINISSLISSITDENLSTVSWQVGGPDVSTVGAAVLRDMGKVVYLPKGSTGASVSTVLRKVQLVTNAPFGTGNSAADNYYTGYIQIGGLTYGGGTGVASRVTRLN